MLCQNILVDTNLTYTYLNSNLELIIFSQTLLSMKLDNTTVYVFLVLFIIGVLFTKMYNDMKILTAQAGVENFNDEEFYPAMRSFGRTSHLNGTINNAWCNPHGQYYVLRYSKPSTFIGQVKHNEFPMTLGYYNSCGQKI